VSSLAGQVQLRHKVLYLASTRTHSAHPMRRRIRRHKHASLDGLQAAASSSAARQRCAAALRSQPRYAPSLFARRTVTEQSAGRHSGASCAVTTRCPLSLLADHPRKHSWAGAAGVGTGLQAGQTRKRVYVDATNRPPPLASLPPPDIAWKPT
jgi:hypothetical protein